MKRPTSLRWRRQQRQHRFYKKMMFLLREILNLMLVVLLVQSYRRRPKSETLCNKIKIGLAHLAPILVVATAVFFHDIQPIQVKEQLPSDYLPQNSFLWWINFLTSLISTVTKFCVIPCYFVWVMLTLLRSDSRLERYVRSFFRTPQPFDCDDSEETPQDIVRNVYFYRKYAFTTGDYDRSVKIIMSKNVYYKRIEPSELTETEKEFWPNLNHDNILNLYKFHAASLDPFFVIQEVKWRNGLDDILYNDNFNKRNDFLHFAIKWAHDILMGLQYLHSKKLYHLDLEPENIMLEFGGRCDASKSKAIIANFQNMKKLNENSNEVDEDAVGFCEYYRPPECFLRSKVDAEKCDMWGLGIIMLEMLSGGLLALWQDQYLEFNHTRRDTHLNKLLVFPNFFAAMESSHNYFIFLKSKSDGKKRETGTRHSPAWNNELVWQIWVFVTDLLKLDSYTRINMENSLQHGFVKNVCNLIVSTNTESAQTDDFKKNVEAFAENIEKAGNSEA